MDPRIQQQTGEEHWRAPSPHAYLMSPERSDLRRQRQIRCIRFSRTSAICRRMPGADSKAVVRPPVLRECRREFETDVDSFDIGIHRRKMTLKRKGKIYLGFGIFIARTRSDGAVERPYEKDHESDFHVVSKSGAIQFSKPRRRRAVALGHRRFRLQYVQSR